MIILLETYAGLSDFSFKPTCTGRRLERVELEKLGLVSEEFLRANKHSSYMPEWYEVKEGDQIRIQCVDDEGALDETFVVPSVLPNPPQRLDDLLRTGMRVYDYLVLHCRRIK